MKKQKTLNNKGFSLVELIIVIAIMAILIGVMAPQLIRYLEKANIASDTQLADTVKTAITVGMMDPEVINADEPGIPEADDTPMQLSAIPEGAFLTSVQETLATTALTDIEGKLKSKEAKEIWFEITASNAVTVTVRDEAGNTVNNIEVN